MKWEYCYLHWAYSSYPEPHNRCSVSFSSKPGKSDEYSHGALEVLGILGDDGWELVADRAAQGGPAGLLILKRPKVEFA